MFYKNNSFGKKNELIHRSDDAESIMNREEFGQEHIVHCITKCTIKLNSRHFEYNFGDPSNFDREGNPGEMHSISTGISL